MVYTYNTNRIKKLIIYNLQYSISHFLKILIKVLYDSLNNFCVLIKMMTINPEYEMCNERKIIVYTKRIDD